METLPAFDLLPWHATLWQRIIDMLANDRFPHALLLTGPRGVGKAHFVRHLAGALVCEVKPADRRPCGQCQACHLTRVDSHPDIHWLAPEEEGKQIRIDAIRELIRRSSLTTQARGRRVFVISPADAMNPAAANALLKTLEEPAPSSCLLLVSSEIHRLPSTIRSRCQKLPFTVVDTKVAGSWLKTQGDSQSVDMALSLAGGSPLLAKRYMEEGRVQQTVELIRDLQALKERRGNPVAVATIWSEAGIQTVLDGLKRIVSDLLHLPFTPSSRLFLGSHSQNLQKLVKNINLRNLFAFMDELIRLEQQLGNNLNPQMLAERIANCWLATTRLERN